MWLHAINSARDYKWREFGLTAWECQQFYDGDADFMYRSDGLSKYDDQPSTGFQITINRPAELVQLFGPAMYFRNPHRQVGATTPPIPEIILSQLSDPQLAEQFGTNTQQQLLAEEARAELMEWYLNYTPHELDLKEHSRKGIDEALVKGRGCLWTELYSPPESSLVMPRSEYGSVDHLLIDPDADSLDTATWIARRRQQPHWMVERKFGLDSDSLKHAASSESFDQNTAVSQDKEGEYKRKQGTTHDLVEYWEIWSKCGAGQRLAGPASDLTVGAQTDAISDTLEQLGDYVYLAIADGVEYPLNLPPELLEMDSAESPELLKLSAHWPIPFWKDGEWPVSVLDFHPRGDSAWPIAHLKPGLAELKLANWIISFLAGRIKWTSRLLLVYSAHLEEEMKDSLETGKDLTMVPMKKQLNMSIRDSVEFIEFPPVQRDIWDIYLQVMELFDKRVGLTELKYGLSGKQMRSATESQIKEEQINIRPDDMAERVEGWQSKVARKEAQAARWFVGPESFAPIVNEPYDGEMQIGVRTQLWAQLIYRPLDYNDPQSMDEVVREFDYRIEAGSIRKPNRGRDQQNMDTAMQSMFQSYFQVYQMTGDPAQLNWLIGEWAKSRDLDIAKGLFQPVPPPAPPPPAADEQIQPESIPMTQGA
jgi:hypothetical protein